MPGETPARSGLRTTVLEALGQWADGPTVAEARRRFDLLTAPGAKAAPEERDLTVGIVATNADAATFDRIHALARAEKDGVVARRYRDALMEVRDPALASRALDITISDEIPPQDAGRRARLVYAVAGWHPQLALTFFKANVAVLTSRESQFERVLGSERAVEAFADAAPLPRSRPRYRRRCRRPPRRTWHAAWIVRRATSRPRRASTRTRADRGRRRAVAGQTQGVRLSDRTYVRHPMRQLALFASAASPTVSSAIAATSRTSRNSSTGRSPMRSCANCSADTQWRADSRLMYGKRVLVPRETAGRGDEMPQPWTPTLATRPRAGRTPYRDHVRLRVPQPVPRRTTTPSRGTAIATASATRGWSSLRSRSARRAPSSCARRKTAGCATTRSRSTSRTAISW